MTSYKRWMIIGALTVLILIGPTSCFFLESCPEALPFFQVAGLKIKNATLTSESLNTWRIVNTNETINYEDYFMQVDFEKTYLSQHRAGAGYSLFALSCNEDGFAGSKVGLDTLYMIAQQDYNSRYLKNDTLNSILLAGYLNYSLKDFRDFFPLTQYIKENSEKIESEKSYVSIRITEPPLADGEFEFKLVFILQNGERFERVSDKIKLKK